MGMRMHAEQSLILEGRPRWTRAKFEQLITLDGFGSGQVELVKGELVKKEEGVPHGNGIEKLTELLVPRLVGRARVRIQLHLVVDDETVLMPDVTVVDRKASRNFQPTRALLAIEVADTSERFDRIVKAPLYAQSGTGEYWIVNVKRGEVEVFSGLRNGRYSKHEKHHHGTLTVPGFDDVEIELSDLF